MQIANVRAVGSIALYIILSAGTTLSESMTTATPVPRNQLIPSGVKVYPTVYLTPKDIERARANVEKYAWARETKEAIIASAEGWLQKESDYWLSRLPGPNACYAYGFTGCPICGAKWGTWKGARCAWDDPGHVTCTGGHRLPDAEHPDDGKGYTAPDGRIHYFVGSYNAWVTENLSLDAIQNLSKAYALTGDERYAESASAIFDGLAAIYSESTAGSWDYPSDPPSGRFARPWYQVARVLVHYVAAYDLLYYSKSLDIPSQREGFTRRRNIEERLLMDGAWYCYSHSFSGALHNGHADYMRGALAVGILLGVPEFVKVSVNGPYSISAMLANNVDRDGRYYETSFGYAIHTRLLYHTFAEPLLNCRVEPFPDGYDLYKDRRFAGFLLLPDAVANVCGRRPNLGDDGPDVKFVAQADNSFQRIDKTFLEYLLAGTRSPEARRHLESVLLTACRSEEGRIDGSLREWLLFHYDPLSVVDTSLPAWLKSRCDGSWVMGQKGIAFLRTGNAGTGRQAVVLRYGPTLNHGDPDELHLSYYAQGYEMTYDLGYGLGSTHAHVGFASQTISHCTVTVDEKSQMGAEGSGGSLNLFASMPGIQLVEASSENAYRAQKVDLYRRTLAMIGEGNDAFLVDIFRVRGGAQHDFSLNSHSRDIEIAGVVPDAVREKGSLAGEDIEWGRMIGNDGDIKGHPNKPYWNPPPENGYGFLHNIRSGRPTGPWGMTWRIARPQPAAYRAIICPQDGDEALICDAPGIYPNLPDATYIIERRKGDFPLASCFAAVHQSAGPPFIPGLISYKSLDEMLVAASAETRMLDDLCIFILKATNVGQEASFAKAIAKPGKYKVSADFLKSPSYGAAALFVDGRQCGETIDLMDSSVGGTIRISAPEIELGAGDHIITIRAMPTSDERGLRYIGIQSLQIALSNEAAPQTQFSISRTERLAVSREKNSLIEPVALLIHAVKGEVLFLSGCAGNGVQKCEIGGESVEWEGSICVITGWGSEAPKINGCGLKRLSAGKLRILATDKYEAEAEDCDYDAATVKAHPAITDGVDLAGSMIIFENPAWTRNSAYTLRALRPDGDSTILEFRDQPLILGKGRVYAKEDGNLIRCDIPHEYARSVRRINSLYFDGKVVRTPDGRFSRIRKLSIANPMDLQMEDASKLKLGDDFDYCDVAPGDRINIPAWFQAEKTADGWRATGTASARIE
ncbi:MAG TPA: heparinase II/III family protein [Candidatus Brocadiia bacterium]|nr:heparinase II/III family protein [Candidatus Brocadiia bacterium]